MGSVEPVGSQHDRRRTSQTDGIHQLVVAARGGDLDAYGQLVERLQDVAYAAAYAQLGDYHLAQDAAQDAFIEAFVNLAKLREPAAFPGWFRQILFRRSVRLAAARHPPGGVAPLGAVDEAQDEQSDPVAVAELRELQHSVHAALRALPDHERLVAALFYIGEHPQTAIARFLDIPVATVKTRLHAARHRMRRSLTAMHARIGPTIAAVTAAAAVRDGLAEPRRQRPSRDARFARAVALFAAAQVGDAARLRKILVDDTTLLEARNEQGWTPLRVAAQRGHVAAVGLLLAAGARVDCEADFGSTPLSRAAQHGHTQVVERLLAAGADPTQLGDGWSALQLAARRGHADVVALLLRHGAAAVLDHPDRYEGWTALHGAAAAGSAATIQILLEHGASVDARTARDGQTALHLAVVNRHPTVVRVLLDHGADANVRDRFGTTALGTARERGDELLTVFPGGAVDETSTPPTTEEFAARRQHDALRAAARGDLPALTRLLDLDAGLANAADHFGQTLLCHAAWRGDLSMVRLLIERGVDVRREDPIYHAGYRGHREVCRLLVGHGGVDHLVPNGEPALVALFRAVYGGESERVDALVRETPDLVHAQDANGYTPLHVAAGHGDVPLMRLLLAQASDLEATCRKGRTPLHRAAGQAQRDAVSLLLAAGARADARDGEGKTPLDLAIEKDRDDHRVADLFFTPDLMARRSRARAVRTARRRDAVPSDG